VKQRTGVCKRRESKLVQGEHGLYGPISRTFGAWLWPYRGTLYDSYRLQTKEGLAPLATVLCTNLQESTSSVDSSHRRQDSLRHTVPPELHLFGNIGTIETIILVFGWS
ncbi:unnamed protein product, partial [Ectocarpus sp. 8 AP-2014]